MSKRKTIEKIVRFVKKNHQASDFAYWQSQPVEKRLEELEELRKQYHQGAQPKFEKVIKITKRRKYTERKQT